MIEKLTNKDSAKLKHLEEVDAVKYYEQEGAKLVILDITLPNMDGFSVCSKIRENGNTPIIIVSARGSKEDMLNGLMLGADDYIEKPYDIDILIAKDVTNKIKIK